MSEWPKRALGSVATIERRGLAPAQILQGTKYLGLENIDRGGKINGYHTIGEVTVASTKFAFSERHVLFGKLRPNLGKVARPDFGGVCSTDILPVLPGPELDRGYLTHFLRQPNIVAFAASRAAGANLPRLSPTELAKFPIPLPPIEAQRRVAAILDRADALRAKRRQALALLDDLTQSIFLDMFGDPAASDAPRPKLRQMVFGIDSGKSPVCEGRPAADDEWGVLKLGAVTYGDFRPDENKAYLGPRDGMSRNEVHSGDVLLTRKNTRELVGACALVRDVRPRLLLPDLIFRIKLDKSRVNPVYFQALLMMPAKRRQVTSLASGSAASMPNISKARLLEMPIELPPLDRQADFAGRIASTSLSRLDMSRQAAHFNALFAALQAQAFSGQL